MTIFGVPILTLIVFLPLVGVALLFFVDKQAGGLAKMITLVVSGATFLVSLPLYWAFDETST
ncbi:MAG: NADH-quinone oxidoreductase subunit M, partial [Deltaproteobacteria bacterium]|nr:NADH-quinone oxidoreductase subunit M [Deltaproteobacteria bacterium]